MMSATIMTMTTMIITDSGHDEFSEFNAALSFFFFFFFLPSTSLWGVYSETFIHRYSIPLTHAFTRLCMIFSPHMYILHYGSSPRLQCAQFSFLSFSQLNISKLELIFKYHGQWKEGVSFFVHTYTFNSSVCVFVSLIPKTLQ